MRRLGIVDLGSNTARLVVYGYQPGLWFRLLDEVGETVRLGEGLGTHGRLTGAAIERAAAALELFRDHADAIGLNDLEVMGTSALRDAPNRDLFLERTEELGLPIRILTGEQEAELGVRAVANGFALEDAWVLDLGGGSAQLSRMRERRYRQGTAYPLGAVRLTEAHLHHDPPRPEEIAELETAVEHWLGDRAAALADDPAPLVAMGGAARTLAAAAQRRSHYPLPLIHGYRLQRAALEELTEELITRTTPQRARMPGLKPARADVIVAAALVYRWLLRRGGRDAVWISGHGLREGAFYRHFLDPPHLLEDVRAFAVDNLFARYQQPPVHTRQVRHLSRQLFAGLAPLHQLDDDAEHLLDAAAILHDIGSSVSHYRHHHHGAYLLTAAPLFGFSHREQALLALLVRYHNKGTPRLGPYKGLAHDDDHQMLLQLCACLRLAESLERSRAGRVRNVEVRLPDGFVELALETEGNPTVEIWEASQQAALVRAAFARKLRIVS